MSDSWHPEARAYVERSVRHLADLDAFAAEHGLTLEPGQMWSGRINRETGEVVDVFACNVPGYPQSVRATSAGPWLVDSLRPSPDVARRVALRRGVYRCRVSALSMVVIMFAAFAADRPIAGVLAAALAFLMLRCAAEARAEL